MAEVHRVAGPTLGRRAKGGSIPDHFGQGNFRIHDLRHTHASYLVQSGASLFEVQKALGHSDSSMTQRYAHLADNTLRDRAEIAVQRLTGTEG